jgi:hypothetical protein
VNLLGSADAEPSSSGGGDAAVPCSPSIAAGKVMWDVITGNVAVVVDINDKGVVLRREDKTPMKKKRRAVANLVVMPYPDRCKPVRAGQQVIVNAGSRATLHHIGRRGVIKIFNTQRCTVAVDGTEELVQLNTEYLHALDGDGVEPTVPLVPSSKFIPREESWQFLCDYQAKNNVNLLGPSRERYEALLADFFKGSNER